MLFEKIDEYISQYRDNPSSRYNRIINKWLGGYTGRHTSETGLAPGDTVVTSLLTGGIFAAALAFAIRAQKTPIRMGQESLIGRVGTVKQDIPTFGAGQVQLASELWTAELAEGDQALPKGTRVEVVAIQGIRLKVKAAQ